MTADQRRDRERELASLTHHELACLWRLLEHLEVDDDVLEGERRAVQMLVERAVETDTDRYALAHPTGVDA